MSASMLKRIAEASPRFKARMASGLFLLLLLTAGFSEFFPHGRLSFAEHLTAGMIEISCLIAVTLLFYDLFKPVDRRLSLLAMCFNCVALALLLLRFLPRGVNIGLGFHGLYWIPDRLLDFQVDLSPSNTGRADGDRRLVLADLLVTITRKLSVPLQSGLRPARGRLDDAVAPRADVSEVGRESKQPGRTRRSRAIEREAVPIWLRNY